MHLKHWLRPQPMGGASDEPLVAFRHTPNVRFVSRWNLRRFKFDLLNESSDSNKPSSKNNNGVCLFGILEQTTHDWTSINSIVLDTPPTVHVVVQPQSRLVTFTVKTEPQSTNKEERETLLDKKARLFISFFLYLTPHSTSTQPWCTQITYMK